MSPRDARANLWLSTYDKLDRALVAQGWPATSPWWRQELERFIRSGKRRWICRCGRRAGKSSTLCRVAITQGLAGSWSVPPGDVAVVAFTSLDRDEAASRIRTIREALTALGIEAQQTADEIVIPSKRLAFRVATCSIRSVGFTAVMLVADEMARWESRDTSANPAKEVMASQRPTMATQPFGIEVCCSSPWGEDDYHAQLFSEGDNDHQQVSFAPSWIANLTLTEQGTRELEPDLRTWSREYAAIPGATVSQALDREDVLAAFADNGSQQWVVDAVGGFDADELRSLSMQDVVDQIADHCKERGVSVVHSDQRESASLESMFAAKGLGFRSYAWGEQSKDSCFMLLRRLLRERQIVFADHPQLKSELLAIKAHLLPSGRTRYATGGLDTASAVITLLHAILADDIRPGTAFCCIDPSSLRGDDFGLISGTNTLPHEPLVLPTFEAENRWAGMSGKGFG